MTIGPEDVMRWQHEQAVRANARKKPKAPRKTKGKAASPEGAVVRACLQYLQMLGCFVWRNNSGGYTPYSDSGRVVRYGKVGSGDIIGLTPTGRHIEIEAKFGNNKQSEYQLEHQRKIESHNGIYILAYSVSDIEARKLEILA